MMTKISYSGYRFPPEIIQQAIWLYVRFRQAFDRFVRRRASGCRDRCGKHEVRRSPHGRTRAGPSSPAWATVEKALLTRPREHFCEFCWWIADFCQGFEPNGDDAILVSERLIENRSGVALRCPG